MEELNTVSPSQNESAVVDLRHERLQAINSDYVLLKKLEAVTLA
jgi:hypothetical protein